MKTIIAAVLALSIQAQATVDALLDVNYASLAVQRSGYCLHKRQMIANIGIFPASVMSGSFTPVMIFDEGRADGITQVDFNVLSEAKVSYVNDSYDTIGNGGDSMEYEMRLDVTDLVAGKEKAEAVHLVKLAILVITKNMADMAKIWKLTLHIDGLPVQDASTGSQVYANTEYPYTAGSPLVKKYLQEIEALSEGQGNLSECF